MEWHGYWKTDAKEPASDERKPVPILSRFSRRDEFDRMNDDK